MKSYDDALRPDPRYILLNVDDPLEGMRPMTFRDHYAMVDAMRLPDGVRPVVDRLYNRALNALLYGWLDYDLMVIAAGQALASLDHALKTRLGEGGAKLRGLGPRLSQAVALGILPVPASSDRGDDHVLLVNIRKRDRPWHGSRLCPDRRGRDLRALPQAHLRHRSARASRLWPESHFLGPPRFRRPPWTSLNS